MRGNFDRTRSQRQWRGDASIAVPESLKLLSHLPEALIVGCPETNTGAIAQLQLPEKTDLSSFDVIACGPGLTLDATRFCKKC